MTPSDIEKLLAERAALRTSLAQLIRYIERIGGFCEHRDQQTIQQARALLVETEAVECK